VPVGIRSGGVRRFRFAFECCNVIFCRRGGVRSVLLAGHSGQNRVFGQPRHDNARGNGCLRAVELPEEAPEQFRAFRQFQIRPEEGAPVHKPPFAHEEEPEGKSAFGWGHARHIHVAAFRQDHALAFHRALDGLDLIPEHGGLFVIHGLGRVLHGVAQHIEQFTGAPGEEQFHAVYEGGVFFNGDVFRARRETLPYMVVEAGPDAVFKGPVHAAPQGEDPVDTLPCLAGRLSRGEGAEIAGVVAPGLTHDLKARIGGVLGDAEQDILLVVAQDDIVVRAVFLDEAGFEEQRFLFRGGGKRLQRGGVPDHGDRFRGQGRSVPEIGKDALAEVSGLAHIDDPSLRVLIDIDAGRGRKS